MFLLAIDPGLDVTGTALFDLVAWDNQSPKTLRDALTVLGPLTKLMTTPKDRPEVRLADLATDLDALCNEYPPQICYIEHPQIHGDYARSNGGLYRKSVNALYEARGALLATLGILQVPVVQVRAGTEAKRVRHGYLQNLFRAAKRELPAGPKGGAEEDIWDAIWIGVWALVNRFEVDMAEAAR